jgi:phenylacetate-coenzyme A ligase PaaK-like adenylate-forming protein
MLAELASERAAGRLTIQPDMVWSGGEYLSPTAHAGLERAFGCPVVNEYGASECLSIAFGCSAGWLHVNADWVIVEAVEADLSPTPAGQVSHSVLVTNLANRVQPVIRYDLGDTIVMHAGRCTCGNPLPALRVHGRCDDVVEVRGVSGRTLRLLPLALTTVVEEAAGIHRFQIVQRDPASLWLRVDPSERGGDGRAIGRATDALCAYLHAQGAEVRVIADRRPPQRDARSGKLRQVVASAK